MVVDTSALVAIILMEPTEMGLTTKILGSARPTIAAPSFLEAHMVLKKHLGVGTETILRSKMRELGLGIVPFNPDHAREATRAFDR